MKIRNCLEKCEKRKSPGTLVHFFFFSFFFFFFFSHAFGSKLEILLLELWMKHLEKESCLQHRSRPQLHASPRQIRTKISFKKSWRPIFLLNVVYKIGSSYIANRIKTVLPLLIIEDQTGFISNWCIGDNIRLIYNLIT